MDNEPTFKDIWLPLTHPVERHIPSLYNTKLPHTYKVSSIEIFELRCIGALITNKLKQMWDQKLINNVYKLGKISTKY